MTFPLRLPALLSAFLLLLAVPGAQAQLKPAPKTAPKTAAKSTASAPAKAGGTAVTVGSVKITKGKIDTLVLLMARSRGADLSEVPPQQVAQMKRMVATNLIGQELLELEAKAQGIKAAPPQVDSALRVLKSQFPDAATYQKAMRQSGESEAAVRAKIARQIRADQVLAANVRQPAMPTEADLHAFWEKNRKEFPVNDSLRAVQILLLADAKVPAEEAADKKRKLESLRRELIKDTGDIPMLLRQFMSEAARNGEGPESQIGGDLQRFHPDDFHAEFKKQVLNLRVGQLSPVFKTPLGYHLVLLIEKYDGKFDSYRLQSLQNLMAQRNMQLGAEMRGFLKKLAAKYPVKYQQPTYRDVSETGIY
ncbi:MAG: PpiC-type peptidyl-prolyl cis-trans isomerase [Fibrobacteria bacterium]|jgi:parvulin-like peptidyl-prolyl isomerase|nr:PpiC-type peptidyl-prolyl cis-trans isomerase [Fibrobacteria bacterium]